MHAELFIQEARIPLGMVAGGSHTCCHSAMVISPAHSDTEVTMSFRRHSAALSALSALALTATAAAQSVPLPREAQVGPRPFYLVDKMKDGPLKTQLSQCTGPFRKIDFSI